MLDALVLTRPVRLADPLQRSTSSAERALPASAQHDPAGVPAPRTRTTRSTQMQLLHEALARAEHSRRLDEAAAARTRRRHLAEARSRRRLEIAVRRLERANSDVDRARARAEAFA